MYLVDYIMMRPRKLMVYCFQSTAYAIIGISVIGGLKLKLTREI